MEKLGLRDQGKSRCLAIAAGIVDTGGKLATGVNNTSETDGNFAAGVVDTGGKFAAGAVDTGGAP
jgi:hypothetical protein